MAGTMTVPPPLMGASRRPTRLAGILLVEVTNEGWVQDVGEGTCSICDFFIALKPDIIVCL